MHTHYICFLSKLQTVHLVRVFNIGSVVRQQADEFERGNTGEMGRRGMINITKGEDIQPSTRILYNQELPKDRNKEFPL